MIKSWEHLLRITPAHPETRQVRLAEDWEDHVTKYHGDIYNLSCFRDGTLYLYRLGQDGDSGFRFLETTQELIPTLFPVFQMEAAL